jgi:flagellar hook-associated protein 3 FlgL
LQRLRDALRSDDQRQITAGAEDVDGDLVQVIRVQGEVGARAKEFEDRIVRIEDLNLATQQMLSELEDADYNEAIIRFQTLQTSLEASLQATGAVLNLSLLDYV